MKHSNHTHLKFSHPDGNKFYSTLRARVEAYFNENKMSRYANNEMIFKSVVLLSLYILPFVALGFIDYSSVRYIMWFLMGIAVAGIGMSVMHDANHGSYSKNKTVNYLMSHTLNLLGGSAFNWRLQHNVLHHTFTNITHVDEDIQDRLVLKFSPHTEVKSFHRFQWLYAFLFYGLITIYWVIAKDFVQYVQFKKNGVNNSSATENNKILLKIILIKVFYLTGIFGVPLYLFQLPVVETILGFLMMHFVAGNILTIIFQLAHTVEHTEHPLPNESGIVENEWAIHQLQTTVNFSPNNKILSWYVGGLNYQIEHHLFPKISHVYYPQIAPIVEQTAKEFNLPYMVNPTFFQALNSHIRLMKKLGKITPDFNTAIA
ncbi:MAG: acyl-CoA desaturase [Bacteroidia bacterium]|nr:acyl-CoA desaturase [Bacteroidia bacterium]